MMDLIFQMLLVPFLPELADQTQDVDRRVKTVAEKVVLMDQGKLVELIHPASYTAPSEGAARLQEPTPPKMSGRVLADTIHLGGGSDESGVSGEATEGVLSLTGILRVGGARVAIVSQGEREFVLAQGSYLSGAYRVKSIDAQSIQLISLKDRAQDLKLVLNTKPAE